MEMLLPIMRVAIVHYHLQPGGVTQVIRSQSRLLDREGIPHVILAESGDADGLPVRWIAGLGYTDEAGDDTEESLFQRMVAAAKDALGSAPDIWHVHNPSLGKNRLMPGLILRLARKNHRLLLQIHDLAEDGREENFRRIPHPARLHPDGPRIFRAFLNQRDLDIFTNAGLERGRAFLLPNSFEGAGRIPESKPSRHALVFYPVRGIRRKNLGEILLLAALSPEGTRYAISRAPLDPRWLPVHDAWRAFAIAHRLAVEFDVSGRNDFQSWIARSTHLVTTSVAEGCGMVFLEAEHWRKPLVGRALPHLPHASGGFPLYRTIHVPTGTGAAEFSNLTEDDQRRSLSELLENPGLRESVKIDGEPATAWLERALAISEPFKAPAITADHLPDILASLMRVETSGVGFLDAGEIRSAYQKIHRSPLTGTPPAGTAKVVIFDIYGTLLSAAAGGVKPDAAADPLLREILRNHGYDAPESPSKDLHLAVLRHHAASSAAHPEVELRELWREVLGLDESDDPTQLVIELEAAWHPAKLIEGAEQMLRRLAADGHVFGLLSNAQCNALDSLGPIAGWFARDLAVLSHQYGHAKPSDLLFSILTEKLAARGVHPGEVWFVGNDPRQDMIPAAAHGFRTALFQGHPDSIRPGECTPDLTIPHWDAFVLPHTHTNPPAAAAPTVSCGET